MIASEIVGTWVLEDCVRMPVSGETEQPYGPTPSGMIVYAGAGFMSCNLLAGGSEHYFYSSYFGRYSMDGPEVVHHVLGSTNPDHVGTDLRRHCQLDGDILTLQAQTQDALVRLRWRRSPSTADVA